MNRRAPSPAFRHQAREGGGTVTTNGKIEVFGAIYAVLKDYHYEPICKSSSLAIYRTAMPASPNISCTTGKSAPHRGSAKSGS
jgi:hypothetical protein